MNNEGERPGYRRLDFDPSVGETHTVNVAQHYISITEDRLARILVKLADAATAQRDVVAPASLFLSLMVVFATTATFKTLFAFILVIIITTVAGMWLVLAVLRAGSHPRYTVDDAMRDITTVPSNVRPIGTTPVPPQGRIIEVHSVLESASDIRHTPDTAE